MADQAPPLPAQRLIERVTEFTDEDLHALCEATAAAIREGSLVVIMDRILAPFELIRKELLRKPRCDRIAFPARLNGR